MSIYVFNTKLNSKIKEDIFVEIYHPEELEYKKIWATCKIVKRQFYNPERSAN